MRTIEIADDVYEFLSNEAARTGTSVSDVVRSRVGVSRKPTFTPEDMGPFKIPPERWREIEDEGRVP